MRRLIAFLLLAAFALSGCINIETQLQPINADIKALANGKDCSLIFAGLGYGVNSVEQAMKNGLSGMSDRATYSQPALRMPITKIRSLSMTEMNVLIFGERCVKVVGE